MSQPSATGRSLNPSVRSLNPSVRSLNPSVRSLSLSKGRSFPAAGVAFLVLSVIGSALMFWRPWSSCSDSATCSIAPGSVSGWILTGSLIMVIIALSSLAIGLIRRVDRSRAES